MEHKNPQKLSDFNLESLGQLKSDNLGKTQLLLFLLPVLGIALFIIIALSADDEGLLNIAILSLFGWFALGVLALLGQGVARFIKSIGQPDYLAQFAQENELFYEKRSQTGISNKPGAIFHVDRLDSPSITDYLHGKTHEYDFSCYKYSYWIGSGKNARNYQAFIVEIELPRKVPQLVIDSLVESVNLDIRSSVLPIQFSESQRLNLEGNFSRYFAVYAPGMEQVYTLSLLTPDVMDVLMRFGSRCDIEMVDNRLYFYWPDVPQNRNDYENIFHSVDSIWGEIGQKLSREGVSMPAFDTQLMLTTKTDVTRLAPKYSPLTIKTVRIAFVCLALLGYASVQLFPALLDSNNSYPFGIDPFLFIYIAGPFTVAGFIAYKLYRQRKLRRELEEHNKN